MSVQTDFNAELHARPSIYFVAPALVEHFALLPDTLLVPEHGQALVDQDERGTHWKVEHHTEFTTLTRVTPLEDVPTVWPEVAFTPEDAERAAGHHGCRLAYRVTILVLGPATSDHGDTLRRFGFGISAGSHIGGEAAQIFSDFQVKPNGSSRILMLNEDLNAYRLGRMVRRLCEIETYRSMALLGLAEAKSLSAALAGFDADLTKLSERNLMVDRDGHKALLDDISRLSAHVVSAAARTRHRFGATAAYAKIVEERIAELRETRITGYQRFGVFVDRRFRPAVRTCQATADRLEQLSRAAMLLIDLLQTRIQVEGQGHTIRQMELMAERTAVQLKIQRAVEGLSIIAITYYVVALSKSVVEALSHVGVEVDPRLLIAVIPVAFGSVALAVIRVRKALTE